jgi:dihydroorotase
MTKKVIRSATIVDPSQGIHEQLDLLIGDGQVLEIGRSLKVGDDTKTFDATGYYLCPGFIELHSHLREPGGEGSETIESGSLAAAKGHPGFGGDDGHGWWRSGELRHTG